MPWQNTIPWTQVNSGAIMMFNADPTNGNLGSIWGGLVRKGTGSNHEIVRCSGQNVSTANFALLRIEARATNDIRFFVDNNMSDGISMTECGSATNANAIPTFNLGPAINVGHVQAGAMNSAASNGMPWTANVDLFAFVQDDPIERAGAALGGNVTEESSVVTEPTRPDPIAGADVAEHYYIEGKDEISDGEIMVAGAVAGEATSSASPYDRKLLGVVSWQPGLEIGVSNDYTLPIALNGRVLTRVNTTGGAIAIGDPITSSDIKGVGMKATKPGKIIGTALEAYSGEGETKIMVNVNIGYYLGEQGDTALIEQPRELTLQKTDEALSSGSSLLTSDEASSSARATLVSKLMDFGQGMTVDKFFVSLGKALFKGQVEFLERVKFAEVVEYLKEVIYSGRVTFKGNVQFNRDTAGRAVIKKGQRFVDITFTNEYDATPIVNANVIIPTMTESKRLQFVTEGVCAASATMEECSDTVVANIFNSNIKVAVTAQTKQGFMILLDKVAPVDLSFSWTAIAVNDAATFTSDDGEGNVAGVEAPVMPTPTDTAQHSSNPGVPVTTVEPTAAPTTVTPTPEPTAEVTPMPSVEPTAAPTTDPTPTP